MACNDTILDSAMSHQVSVTNTASSNGFTPSASLPFVEFTIYSTSSLVMSDAEVIPSSILRPTPVSAAPEHSTPAAPEHSTPVAPKHSSAVPEGCSPTVQPSTCDCNNNNYGLAILVLCMVTTASVVVHIFIYVKCKEKDGRVVYMLPSNKRTRRQKRNNLLMSLTGSDCST